MKFRKGFVTNSSSSSFVCQICGATAGGWDMSLWEAGFVNCENGHEFCEDHVLYPDDEEWEEYAENDDWRYELSEKYCPLCQMKDLTDEDFIAYLSLKGITRKDTLEEIKSKFSNYEDFKNYLRG